jgi:hypothetical protein
MIWRLFGNHGPDGKPCTLRRDTVLKIENMMPEEVVARISLTGAYENIVPPVDIEVKVRASCTPSCIKMYCSSEFDDSTIIDLEKEFEWTVGSVIKNVHFKVFDSDKVELKKVIIKGTKVSWVQKTSTEDGNSASRDNTLPDICTAKTVGPTPVYYNLTTYLESSQHECVSLVFEFRVTLKPCTPAGIKLQIANNGTINVKADSPFSHDILLRVVDQLGNGVRGLTEASCDEVVVHCKTEGSRDNILEEDKIEKVLGNEPGVIVVRRVQFRSLVAKLLGTKPVKYKIGPDVRSLAKNSRLSDRTPQLDRVDYLSLGKMALPFCRIALFQI